MQMLLRLTKEDLDHWPDRVDSDHVDGIVY